MCLFSFCSQENYWENCGIDDKDSFASLRKFFFETLGDRTWQELVKEYAPALMCSQASGRTYALMDRMGRCAVQTRLAMFRYTATGKEA